MKAAAITFLVFIPLVSVAGGRPPPPPPPEATAIAIQGQIQGQHQHQSAVAQAKAGAVSGSVSNASIAEGAVVINEAPPGPVLGEGAIQVQGDTFTDNAVTNVITDNPRQAPPVYAPAMTNTAPGLKCLGAAASFAEGQGAGGGAVGHCWIQRDQMALHMYHQHAERNQPEQAARQLCAKPLLRAGYKAPGMSKQDVIDKCIATEIAAIERYHAKPIPPMMPPPSQCDEKLKRCETVTRK